VAAVEADRHAAQTYRMNHPGVPVLEGNVEAVKVRDLRSWLPGLGPVDAVIAGPPCQGYSAAGARDIGDKRNLLFRQVTRLASELKARAVVIENVPGVRRVNGVSYTRRIVAAIRSAGFTTSDAPFELRACEYGVSQKRRRLFFVGVRKGIRVPVHPSATHAPPRERMRLDDQRQRTPTLRAQFSALPRLDAGEGAERLVVSPGAVVLNSTVMNHSAEVVAKIAKIQPGSGPISYRRLDFDLARTLVAGHRALPVHPSENRTITVREAARIQGFPDSYFFCGPRASQPLQVANAVPPALSEAVASSVAASLSAPS
jgi:DNA (cytosine-5)-methyltransferase 1